jgi:hypothetical protein
MDYRKSTRKLGRTLLLVGALLSLTGLAECPPSETEGGRPSWENHNEPGSSSGSY